MGDAYIMWKPCNTLEQAIHHLDKDQCITLVIGAIVEENGAELKEEAGKGGM